MTTKEKFEILFADGGWVDFIGAVCTFVLLPISLFVLMGLFV